MAIFFSCKCGKSMVARNEFAGRRMKCPSCGTVLTIPEQTVDASLGGAEASLPPKATAKPVESLPAIIPDVAKTVPPPLPLPPPLPKAVIPTLEFAQDDIPVVQPIKGRLTSPFSDGLVSQASAPWRDAAAQESQGIARFHHEGRADSHALAWLTVFLVIAVSTGALLVLT